LVSLAKLLLVQPTTKSPSQLVVTALQQIDVPDARFLVRIGLPLAVVSTADAGL
jgi:hypothetical protein